MINKNRTHNSSCLSDETVVGWAEGRLSPSEQEQIAAHLKVCAGCRALVDAYVEVTQQLKNEVLLSAPDDYRARAKALVEKKWRDQILDVVVKFSDKIIAAVETSGQVLVAPWLPSANQLRGLPSPEVNLVLVEKVYKNFRCRLEVSRQGLDFSDVTFTLHDARSGKSIENIRVVLYSEDQEMESYVTTTGRVSFERLVPALYRLEILGLETCPLYLSLNLIRS